MFFFNFVFFQNFHANQILLVEQKKTHPVQPKFRLTLHLVTLHYGKMKKMTISMYIDVMNLMRT